MRLPEVCALSDRYHILDFAPGRALHNNSRITRSVTAHHTSPGGTYAPHIPIPAYFQNFITKTVNTVEGS